MAETKPPQTRNAFQNLNATRIFLFVCIYRLANALVIRTQFDPDEYWQTLEPAYCLAFGSKEHELQPDESETSYGCALTWEWTRRWTPSNETSEENMPAFLLQAMHGPIRSYVSILPTYWYYLACKAFLVFAERNFCEYLKQFVQRNVSYIISKGPALLHAVTIAAPTDLSVWLVALRLESLNGAFMKHKSISWSSWALILSLTSWFNGYALIRTYANCFETVCLAVGLVLLGPDLFGESSNSKFKQNSLRSRMAFILGGLSACVRFTSLAAWIPLGVAVTIRSEEMLHTLFGTCALFGSIGVGLGCCIDRIMYGFWAIPFLGNFHFNVILGFGSLYGTHPLMWYIYAGIPAICGAILVPFLLELKSLLSVTNKLTDDSAKARMTLLGIIISYVSLHSVSEHKEFRFLLPVLPFITVLAAHTMAQLFGKTISKKLRNSIMFAFIVLNIPHLLYLGIIHQRGPIAVNQFLVKLITPVTQKQQPVHIHYLMGCHSAPLYSHLHMHDIHVRAWHLDCSPKCRSQSGVPCESDSFLVDPNAFIRSIYGDGSNQEQCSLEHQKIVGPTNVPSFVVVMQDEAEKIHHILHELGMRHAGSIKHAIKSLTLHHSDSSTCSSTSHICHDAFTMLSLVDIHFVHMEVYQLVI